jgi:Tfp pilus assembly protein PilN
MFWKRRFENIFKSKKSNGVEFVLLPDNTFEINAIVLQTEKSLLNSIKKVSGIHTIEELATIIDFKSPVVLIINGKGIVHRKINTTINETYTPTALLNKVLPNANDNDFYIQQQPIDSANTIVSVVRAEIINEIIDQLRQKNIINIVSCLLGPFCVNNLLPLINSNIIQNSYLCFANYKLLIHENQLIDIKVNEEFSSDNIAMVGEDLAVKLVIPFAGAFSYFTHVEKGIFNAPKIELIKEDFKQRQRFNKIALTTLVLSFFILFVNYFAFTAYWTEANKLSTQLILNQTVVSKYDTLKKEYERKKEFLEQNGLLENAKTSYYSDKLAATLPSSIKWTDLSIHPLKKKKTDAETTALFFDNKTIRINGKCQRSTDLNKWMKDIKKNSWVADLQLLNYTQDNAIDAGLFLIQLTLK